jgi:predicted nucleic acid-binding protein
VSFLLDTNFLSDVMKPAPNLQVAGWIRTADQESLHVSVVTFAELRRGIELLDRGKRRSQLEDWISLRLGIWFGDRILSIDRETAEQCGRMLAQSKRRGWNLDAMDAFIAATAQVHDLTLATLNRKHFEKVGVRLLTF